MVTVMISHTHSHMDGVVIDLLGNLKFYNQNRRMYK